MFDDDGSVSNTRGGKPLKSLSTLFNCASALDNCVSNATSSVLTPPEVIEVWVTDSALDANETAGIASFSLMNVDRKLSTSSFDRYDGVPT